MNFAEQHLVVNCTTKASDILAGSLQSDIYNMSNWRDAFFILTVTSGGTGTARVHLRSAGSVTAATSHGMEIRYRYRYGSTGASTLTAWTTASSSGFITTADENYVVEVWGRSENMYDGDKYILWDSTEIAADPVGGALTLLLANPRVGEDISPDVLS